MKSVHSQLSGFNCGFELSLIAFLELQEPVTRDHFFDFLHLTESYLIRRCIFAFPFLTITDNLREFWKGQCSSLSLLPFTTKTWRFPREPTVGDGQTLRRKAWYVLCIRNTRLWAQVFTDRDSSSDPSASHINSSLMTSALSAFWPAKQYKINWDHFKLYNLYIRDFVKVLKILSE